MKPATETHWQLREKLLRLAECGSTEGERASAKARKQHLETKYEFYERPIHTEDIFANVKKIEPARDFRPLDLKLSGNDPHAAFVKWAVESGYQIETRWRGDGLFSSTLTAGVLPRSIPNVSKSAAYIAETFAKLWQTFQKLPGATEKDCRLFMLGLCDGMIGSERKRGEKLPVMHQKPSPSKAKRKAIQHAPALAINPYETAVELGKRARLSAPVRELEHDLCDAEQRARLESCISP